MRLSHKNLAGDERATSAIEFSLVGPAFIMFLIGTFYLCMTLAVAGSLHYAVEEGARCASVRTTVCTDHDTTIEYTKGRYFGPSSVPLFIYDAGAPCGHSVTASIDYVLDLGIKQFTVPLTAAACFP